MQGSLSFKTSLLKAPIPTTMTRLIPLLALLLLTQCQQGEKAADSDSTMGSAESVDMAAPSGTMEEKVDTWIANNDYDAALEWLGTQDEADPDVKRQLEKVWLNYGYHSMRVFDPAEMRTQMNWALTCFAEVLTLNDQNEAARGQIDQILGVYATMPDRGPDPDVMDRLAPFGY